MERPPGTTVVALFVALAAGASAQEKDLPPGAKLKVLDLVFKVEDFGAKTADLRVKETDTEVRIELAADVLFDFDKATLRSEAEQPLGKVAALIKERGGGAVRIEGHTDSKGDDAYNQKLSERRAESVRQWFVSRGLGGRPFSVRGFGETRPVAPNSKPDGTDDPAGRQKNRRVEIVIAKRR
jgi:outer membrane protein OmpA-like peptidoglycan-associated protein